MEANPLEDVRNNTLVTRTVADIAVEFGAKRFVFVSSLSAREPALSMHGASKAEAEKSVASSKLDWTVVRPPGVYGPRDIDYFEMFRTAKMGFVPLPTRGASCGAAVLGAQPSTANPIAAIPPNLMRERRSMRRMILRSTQGSTN